MTGSKRIMAMIGVLAALAAASCSAAGNGPAEITVEPAKTHQVMNGWEATARLWEVNKAEDRYDRPGSPCRTRSSTAS